MPELPDVEVFKRYVDATSLHKKIRQVDIKDDSVLKVSAAALRRHLQTHRFEGTRRIGKHLFLSTESDKWLMLHFGMTGNLQYSEDDGLPDHTRLLLGFENGGRLAYNCQRKLGSIALTESPAQFASEHGLGDDGLGIDFKKFDQLLADKRGMIKTALMDQHMIAGLGNVYSGEVLYQSRIHPKTKTGDLSDEQLKNLYQNMQRILQTAINNQVDPGAMPDHYLISHREKGTECPQCGGSVKRIKVSGRGCYFCRDCQKL